MERLRRPTPVYQVSALKYRPQTFAELVNQVHVRATLENAFAHGYIFSGRRSAGKTTVMRILARPGLSAGADVTIDPSHPGYPNGWCLRHYGFLGVNYPGLDSLTLAPGRPLTLKYRVTVYASAAGR